jgi:hypothetical protein
VPEDGGPSIFAAVKASSAVSTIIWISRRHLEFPASLRACTVMGTERKAVFTGRLGYSFIRLDNSVPSLDGSNPITSRVGQLLRAGGINGVQGLYLKQVGGPVLANLEESFTYEPAAA